MGNGFRRKSNRLLATGVLGQFRLENNAGRYDLAVQYFDERSGVARYKLTVAGRIVAEWMADDTLPSDQPNGHTSTRKTVRGIALLPGDEIRIDAQPDGKDHADIDYVEITAARD